MLIDHQYLDAPGTFDDESGVSEREVVVCCLCCVIILSTFHLFLLKMYWRQRLKSANWNVNGRLNILRVTHSPDVVRCKGG